MRKIRSKQVDVRFTYCPYPITLDKSKYWGKGNVQQFPDGVFLKLDDFGIVTHGVKPEVVNSERLPVGWSVYKIEAPNITYRKRPIWIGELLHEGIKVLNTLDGEISYSITEPSFICYNGINEPDEKDVWVQTVKDLKKNYEL